MMKTPIATLQEEIRTCRKCPLSRTRTRAVPGYGSPDAKIIFVGEAPGANENREGIPFIGEAGELLDELLAHIGISRFDVYVTNIVKCFPPRSRDPRPLEINACRDWLNQEFDLVTGSLVVALGRYAAAVLCPDIAPAELRGTAHYHGGIIEYFSLHPAAALHNPDMRPELERHFETIAKLI